jgi:hypothetical protein
MSNSPAYQKAFQDGAAWVAEELRKDVVTAIAHTILEVRKECADICRNNGEHISATEIDQLGGPKQ